MPVDHLYVHVPFCASKCPYCDFNSHAGRDGEVPAYVEALVAEARARARDVAPATVFVGGGTPTWPSAEAIDRMLDGVMSAVTTSRLTEVTVEANPGTLTPEKVRVLRRHGVTRVSLGAQSFDERRLRVLGRAHDARDTVRSVEVLRDGGVERVSLDLILATPGQSVGEQRRDVARAVALGPEHVSTYVLTFEEGTAFTKSLEEGRLEAPIEGRDLAHLRAACEDLAAAGYRRYEVSNHAKPGAECRHNLGYWRNAQWLGLGAGAHSHVGGRRWKNVDDPAAYAARVAAAGEAVAWEEQPAPRSALFESLMMGLRLVDEGVDLAALAARHGVDPRVEHRDAIERHVVAGRLERDGDRLRCTPAGIDVLNAVLVDFVPDEDDARG
ncbi:MAG: radical SAM family heme chaperone HemW [Planctomycetes bacterium]|nr:radical SAM family heme chaperone HemW [Planctomycetota bacterium]